MSIGAAQETKEDCVYTHNVKTEFGHQEPLVKYVKSIPGPDYMMNNNDITKLRNLKHHI